MMFAFAVIAAIGWSYYQEIKSERRNEKGVSESFDARFSHESRTDMHRL